MNAPYSLSPSCRRFQRGVAIVEVMMAAVILVVGLMALLSAIASSMVVDAAAVEQNRALDISREVLEHVRSQQFGFLLTEKANLGDPAYGETVTANWYGGPLLHSTPTHQIAAGQEDAYSCIEMKAIDTYGFFDVQSRRGSLNEANPNVKVGRVRINTIPDVYDVVEVVVTLEWQGIRGVTREELRCRIPDWKMPYYGAQP
ncbi:MAG: hypothetical protein AB1696_20230 [Planctomycetota bacterium]